ncbi:hypothetical protein SNEBB_011283 [Seison nebaliae]|nr:hypothetical protein SNEBB_011283 [Seison nebaliae]
MVITDLYGNQTTELLDLATGSKIYKSCEKEIANDCYFSMAAKKYFDDKIMDRTCGFKDQMDHIRNIFAVLLLVSNIIQTLNNILGHMYSIIRYVDDTGWFLISDLDVYKLENLWDYTKTFKYEQLQLYI